MSTAQLPQELGNYLGSAELPGVDILLMYQAELVEIEQYNLT